MDIFLVWWVERRSLSERGCFCNSRWWLSFKNVTNLLCRCDRKRLMKRREQEGCLLEHGPQERKRTSKKWPRRWWSRKDRLTPYCEPTAGSKVGADEQEEEESRYWLIIKFVTNISSLELRWLIALYVFFVWSSSQCFWGWEARQVCKVKKCFMHRLNKIIRSPDRIGNEPDNWGKESGRGWKGIGNQKWASSVSFDDGLRDFSP